MAGWWGGVRWLFGPAVGGGSPHEEIIGDGACVGRAESGNSGRSDIDEKRPEEAKASPGLFVRFLYLSAIRRFGGGASWCDPTIPIISPVSPYLLS